MTTLGLGVAGWGNAGALMAEAATAHDRVRLAGIAEVDTARRDAAAESGVPVYGTLDELVRSSDVEAVYLATPTPLHARHARVVVEAGKHVVVEKPMAVELIDALEVCRLADQADVRLLVGSTHSYDAPNRLLRELVEDGELGPLLAVHSLCRTDWLNRTRSVDDLAVELGGGLVMRQGAHQFDILRYIVGTPAEQVYGATIGASDGHERGYAAMVGFQGGVVATATYAGVGGFDSRLLTLGVGETGEIIAPPAMLRDHFLLAGEGDPTAPMFGQCLATFHAAEVLTTPYGALVFQDGEAREITCPANWTSGWDAVLDELVGAVHGVAPVHDGYWGVATLELTAAVHASARSKRPVQLEHQLHTKA